MLRPWKELEPLVSHLRFNRRFLIVRRHAANGKRHETLFPSGRGASVGAWTVSRGPAGFSTITVRSDSTPNIASAQHVEHHVNDLLAVAWIRHSSAGAQVTASGKQLAQTVAGK